MVEPYDLQAWRAKLAKNGRGEPRKNLTNLVLFLQNLPDLGRDIRWNSLAERVEWRGKPLTENDVNLIRLMIEAHDYDPVDRDMVKAITMVAHDNAYHPVQDYLAGLSWDGAPRLDTWMHDCLGADDTPYTRLVARKSLIAAVARARDPGCQVDTVVVLEGDQGVGKSSAIRTLFGAPYFSDSVNLFDQHSKMVMAMMGKWCVEISEFAAVSNARRSEAVKGLITTRVDRVVLPYARLSSDHPRQCVFWGTINPEDGGYLSDRTGNRRYWPVHVSKCDLDDITEVRDQLWAEAVRAYEAGETWWMDSDGAALVSSETSARADVDAWDEVLAEKLAVDDRVTAVQALHALGMSHEDMDKRALNRVAACLRRVGFDVVSVGKINVGYGRRQSVKVYSRPT